MFLFLSGAHNGVIAAQVSIKDIAAARAKLRQNSREDSAPSSNSTRFSAVTSFSTANTTVQNSENSSRPSSVSLRSNSTSREGDALETTQKRSEEKKKEISLELQYFLNRNKDRGLPRSYEPVS